MQTLRLHQTNNTCCLVTTLLYVAGKKILLGKNKQIRPICYLMKPCPVEYSSLLYSICATLLQYSYCMCPLSYYALMPMS